MYTNIKDFKDTIAPAEVDTIDLPGLPEYAQRGVTKDAQHKYQAMRQGIMGDIPLDQEYEKVIFILLCRAAENSGNNLADINKLKEKVVQHGAQNSLRNISTDLSTQTSIVKTVKKLLKSEYIFIVKGTEDNPQELALSFPGQVEKRLEAGTLLKLKGKVLSVLEKMQNELRSTHQPFPIKEMISEKLKQEDHQIDLSGDPMEKFLIDIKSEDFNEVFINKNIETENLVRIQFKDESIIILSTSFLNDILHQVLDPKVREHIRDNKNLEEKIGFFYTKSKRKAPPLESVFQDEVTEAAFFWISNFFEIMEEEQNELRKGDITRLESHRFIYQVAELLYFYTLKKRELLLKMEADKKKREDDKLDLEKKMLQDFQEPWTIVKLKENINKFTQREEKYTNTNIEEMIKEINKPAESVEKLPNIITIETADGNFYVHKFRFMLMLFKQQVREEIRVKNRLVEKWAENPERMAKSESRFDADIWDELQPFFQAILRRNIPAIFSTQDPGQSPFMPEETTLKKLFITTSDLIDGKKQTSDFKLFKRLIFEKGSISDFRSIHKILDLHLKNVQTLAKNARKKNIPFNLRNGFFYVFFFGWLLDLFIRSSIKQSVERAAVGEDVSAQLKALLEVYPKENNLTVGQLSYLKKKISDVISRRKTRQGKVNKILEQREKKTAIKEAEKRADKIQAVKEHFLDDSTINAKLQFYTKRMFVKAPQAEKASLDAIKYAFDDFMIGSRRNRQIKRVFSVDSIIACAKAILHTMHPSERVDMDAMQNYVEILVLNSFLKKVEK